jgi:hypothetical protein
LALGQFSQHPPHVKGQGRQTRRPQCFAGRKPENMRLADSQTQAINQCLLPRFGRHPGIFQEFARRLAASQFKWKYRRQHLSGRMAVVISRP